MLNKSKENINTHCFVGGWEKGNINRYTVYIT